MSGDVKFSAYFIYLFFLFPELSIFPNLNYRLNVLQCFSFVDWLTTLFVLCVCCLFCGPTTSVMAFRILVMVSNRSVAVVQSQHYSPLDFCGFDFR